MNPTPENTAESVDPGGREQNSHTLPADLPLALSYRSRFSLLTWNDPHVGRAWTFSSGVGVSITSGQCYLVS